MPYTSTAIVYTIRALGATLDPQTVRHDRADSSHTVSLRPTSMLACYDRVSPHFALLSCWQVQAMVVDSHVHCEDPMEFEARIIPELQRGAVDAAVLFCPVADVYDRHDPGFQDTLQWRTRRREANRRVVALGGEGARVIPYYFVWNDFDVEELARGYRGVKCHRHDDESVYHYANSPVPAENPILARRSSFERAALLMTRVESQSLPLTCVQDKTH